MIRRALFLLFILLSFLDCTATIVKGTVIDVDGNPLAFASISVQGTKTGVSANAEGFYELNLLPGKYKVSCQYVGFAKQERIITVGVEVVRVDFVLQKQELILPDLHLVGGIKWFGHFQSRFQLWNGFHVSKV